MAQATKKALARRGITTEQIDLMIPHQANLRLIESVAKYAGVPMDMVFLTVDGYGNMSAATVPVALVEALKASWVTPVGQSAAELPPIDRTALEFVNVIRSRRGSRGASELRLMAPRFAETGLLPGIGSYGK
jgi:3-oxoacyl-[acyl-carrier-protein] synthase-3